VNEEEKAFNFSFDEESCRAEAHAAQLFVEPMSGSIPAKSRYKAIFFINQLLIKEDGTQKAIFLCCVTDSS
jgi:hypothetical protein